METLSKTIAVVSGKGGTGKTSVATALFYVAKKHFSEHKPLLLDCDVEAPDASLFFKAKEKKTEKVLMQIPQFDEEKCIYCGKCAEACAFNAIMFIKSLKHISFMPDLCHSCGACSYVCPAEGAITEIGKEVGELHHHILKDGLAVSEGMLKIGEPMPVPVIKALKKSAPPTGLHILDAPPGTSCPVMETIADADFVVVVSEPTPFGINDLGLIAEAIREIGLPFGVIINKDGLTDGIEIHEWLKKEQVPLLGKIPFSRELAKQYAEGKKVPEILPETTEFFKNIIELVINQQDEA